MLGDSITINLGGAGGTARTLQKINQDGYSAEYLERTTTDELRMFVRHTSQKANGTKAAADRHNVEIRWKVFASDPDPEVNRSYYFVATVEPGDVAATAIDLVEGLVEWQSSANLTKVLNWES